MEDTTQSSVVQPVVNYAPVNPEDQANAASFAEAMRANGYAHQTVVNYQADLLHVSRFLQRDGKRRRKKPKTLMTMGQGDLKSWDIDQAFTSEFSSVSPATHDRRRASLATFLRWRDTGGFDKNVPVQVPWRDDDDPNRLDRGMPKIADPASLDEARRAALAVKGWPYGSHTNHRDKAVLFLLAETPMAARHLESLRLRDYRKDESGGYLRANAGGWWPLSPEATEAMDTYLDSAYRAFFDAAEAKDRTPDYHLLLTNDGQPVHAHDVWAIRQRVARETGVLAPPQSVVRATRLVQAARDGGSGVVANQGGLTRSQAWRIDKQARNARLAV